MTSLTTRDHLDLVAAAASRADQAAEQLRERTREAVAAGVTVADAARAANVTRQTVYRWIA